jgi:hypothetical protein
MERNAFSHQSLVVWGTCRRRKGVSEHDALHFLLYRKSKRRPPARLFPKLNPTPCAGKTSRKHRRKALPAFPTLARPASMAGHCVLPRAAPVQVGALRQEAHRGLAVLPGQAARGGRVWAFCRDFEQGAVEQVGEQAGYRVERV